MSYVEAPTDWNPRLGEQSVFLAGGITDCPDWQAEARRLIGDKAMVLNPRRENFPMDDPAAAEEQIVWEWQHLARATVRMFWFPASSSVQPIALFELGRWLDHLIVVGADPGYLRRQDVEIQLQLERPTVQVHETLEATVADTLLLLEGL